MSGLCCASAINEWSVSSVHLDTHNCRRFKHFSLIFWIDASVMESQECRFKYSIFGQYRAKKMIARSLIFRQPFAETFRNFGQPRASASMPFSVTASHQEMLISVKFYKTIKVHHRDSSKYISYISYRTAIGERFQRQVSHVHTPVQDDPGQLGTLFADLLNRRVRDLFALR